MMLATGDIVIEQNGEGTGGRLTERLRRLPSFDEPTHRVSRDEARFEQQSWRSELAARREASHPVAHAMPSHETGWRSLQRSPVDVRKS